MSPDDALWPIDDVRLDCASRLTGSAAEATCGLAMSERTLVPRHHLEVDRAQDDCRHVSDRLAGGHWDRTGGQIREPLVAGAHWRRYRRQGSAATSQRPQGPERENVANARCPFDVARDQFATTPARSEADRDRRDVDADVSTRSARSARLEARGGRGLRRNGRNGGLPVAHCRRSIVVAGNRADSRSSHRSRDVLEGPVSLVTGGLMLRPADPVRD